MSNAARDYRRLDVAVLLTLAALVTWYALDTWRASPHILNWILVLPVAVATLALCTYELVLGKQTNADQAAAAANDDDDQQPLAEVMPIIGVFAAYVIGLEWLGFDVGTGLFVGAYLWLRGERRLPWLLGYSLVFALGVALFFSNMLPYPMPMLLLETDY